MENDSNEPSTGVTDGDEVKNEKSRYHTKNGRTSKRGLLVDGVWHCECKPRLRARRFQTVKKGPNQGRWFYTCRKPQSDRCPFFLWADDAKLRERATRTIHGQQEEPSDTLPEPKTPERSTKYVQPSTPQSGSPSRTLFPNYAWSPSKIGPEVEEIFDWSSSGDEELASVAADVVHDRKDEDINEDEASMKTPHTSHPISPTKRSHTEMSTPSWLAEPWLPSETDVFLTPPTSALSHDHMSPPQSRSKLSRQDTEPLPSSSNLVSEALEILEPANLPFKIEKDLIELLNRHEMRAQGISRGRDITRVALQAKERKTSQLEDRIAALEAEKERNRMVIAHLKHDMATSPRKPSRSRFRNKSEV